MKKRNPEEASYLPFGLSNEEIEAAFNAPLPSDHDLASVPFPNFGFRFSYNLDGYRITEHICNDAFGNDTSYISGVPLTEPKRD